MTDKTKEISMQSTPSSREALTVLDQVGQVFNGTRRDHVNIQQAVNVLNMLVMKDEAITNSAPVEPLVMDAAQTESVEAD